MRSPAGKVVVQLVPYLREGVDERPSGTNSGEPGRKSENRRAATWAPVKCRRYSSKKCQAAGGAFCSVLRAVMALRLAIAPGASDSVKNRKELTLKVRSIQVPKPL